MTKSRIRNKQNAECTKVLEIEIPLEAVNRAREEIYKEIKKIAKVPGFRVGQAPQDILEKHHSKDAEEEVLKKLIPDGYKKAVEFHKITPVGSPEIEKVTFEKGKTLTYEATVEIKPAIRLKGYKGLKITKRKSPVTEAEVDQAVLRLRDFYAKYNDVERSVGKNDYAICDVEAFIENKAISKNTKDMWVQANKEASLLGIGEELVGLAKGQTKEINVKLPENYPDKKYAGKDAKFKVSVKSVKEKELPKIDENFAKTLNKENLNALKEEIRTQLVAKKESAEKIHMENQILEKLLKEHKFPVPENIVKRQKEYLEKRLRQELSRNGVSTEEINERLKKADNELAMDAVNKVRVYFLLDEIALKDGVSVTAKDLEKRIAEISQSAGRPEKEIKENYEKEGLLNGLVEEIKETKTLEMLLKEAKITEA
ncbi:MAG: trigger factor [Candidatus Omnitrophica bacterium]|nr:trigger factor [Candidatus Omnitrophota bacterium]